MTMKQWFFVALVLGYEDLSNAQESETLVLATVDESVNAHFPRVQAASERVSAAEAEVLAARGAFDPVVDAQWILRVGGYYELSRLNLEVRQPTPLWGAEVYAGYRRSVGNDSYPTYYSDQTLAGGELRAGVVIPLWRNGPLDARRAGVERAEIRSRAQGLSFLAARLSALQAGREAYLRWVAAGMRLVIARSQLDVASSRAEQLAMRVRAGQVAEVEVVDAQRIEAVREAQLHSSRRSLEAAAIVLGLYRRGADGRPLPPLEEALPGELPAAATPVPERIPECNPLVQQARHEVEALVVDVRLARAERAPTVELGAEVSRDFGEPTIPSLAGTNLEFRARVSMPLAFRTARGRLDAAERREQAERFQLTLLEETLANELRDAHSQRRLALLRTEALERAAEAAQRLWRGEVTRYEAGASDLLAVNLREQAFIDAKIAVVDAQLETALAEVKVRGLTSCR